MKILKKMKLQYKIMFLTIGMMALVLTVAAVWVAQGVESYVKQTVEDKALTIARTAANIPIAGEALLSDHPSELLQPVAEKLRRSTGAAFVIYSNMQQIRITYPIPEKVGTPMARLYRNPVLQGREYIYLGKGSLDASLRANVPIFREDTGQQIGFVSVGVYTDDIDEIVDKSMQQLWYAVLLAFVLGVAGAVLLSRHIKKVIFDLEPHEIAMILKERVATLQAIREGVIAVDGSRRIRVCNHEAAKLLRVDPQAVDGRLIDSILPENRLAGVIESGQPLYDEVQKVADKMILANSVPVIVDAKVVGAVVSFRDRTEINQMAEELTGIHRLVDVLRAQTHEFKNKLHTVVGLIQLERYDEAIDYAIDNQINQEAQFKQIYHNIKDHVICGLLLGKASQMQELGIAFTLDAASGMTDLPVNVTSGDLVLILGNLLQNSVEALNGEENKSIYLMLAQEPGQLTIKVQNSGVWIADELAYSIYNKGITTKAQGSGLGLALIVEKLRLINGTISHRNLPQGGVEFEVIIPYRRG